MPSKKSERTPAGEARVRKTAFSLHLVLLSRRWPYVRRSVCMLTVSEADQIRPEIQDQLPYNTTRKWMMKTSLDRDVDVIRAAGGLVWRDSPHGKLLAIVHRRRYGDEWSLPKGKLKKHETWLEAARREVQEETACRVQVDGFAGVIGYLVEDKPKVVRFWHMSVTGKSGERTDTEVDQVDWLPVAEACARLTYPLERAFVESAQPPLAGTREGEAL